MKLDATVLRFALQELDLHLIPDLQFTIAFRDFMTDKVDANTYLLSAFGFKKFIHVYGVSRTLGAGDECRLKILDLLHSFPFKKGHIENINSLAERMRDLGLSSNAANGGFGLPRSFCSKLLYVYMPDEIIPYDSYVMKSLATHFGQPIKNLHQYYEQANHFRQLYFPEHGSDVKRLRKKYDTHHLSLLESLSLKPDLVFSWKLSDKYLWCAEEMNRKNRNS